MPPEFFLLFVIIILIYSFARGAFSVAPWVPSRRRDWLRIEQVASFQPGDRFIDLGSGSGGLLLFLAKRHPQVEFSGVEINWLLFFFSWWRVKFSGVKNLKVVWRNVFRIDISPYNKIFLYGYPSNIKKKMSKFLSANASTGALLFSYVFSFPGLNLQKRDQPDKDKVPIYIYKLK